MKVLVFGLGALGTAFSCLLKESGHYVVGVDREQVVTSLKDKQVKVTGIWGDHAVHLDEIVTDIEKAREKSYDLVLVTVKSFVTGTAAREVSKVLTPETLVVLAQNGLGNFETAVEYLSENQLLLGRVIFGAETISVGYSKVTVIADDVVIGSPNGSVDESRVAFLAKTINSAGIPTKASKDVMKYVWGKVIYNSALNSLGAILEVPYGKLAEIPYSKVIMDKMIQETFQVLEAIGQETFWPNAAVYLGEFYNKLVPATKAHHASMLQDIRGRRKTEIMALNGAIVALGQKYGVATPTHQVVTQLVQAKESLGLLEG